MAHDIKYYKYIFIYVISRYVFIMHNMFTFNLVKVTTKNIV